MSLQARFAGAMTNLLASPSGRIGVAVSGGSDSLALTYLAAGWASDVGCEVELVSVDHGLRPEAADEAKMVADVAVQLGVHHTILRWSGWDRRGNLQDEARKARRRLMAQWARTRGIRHICLGHTLDDQAETVLMRLARGSGVDGLSGMAMVSEAEGLLWMRPMLDLRRQDLRDWLSDQNIRWVEDPSNEDTKYNRVKARQTLTLLEPLGMTPERLSQTATHMQSARWALRIATHDLAKVTARQDAGDVVLALPALQNAPQDLQTRLVSSALNFVSGQEYRPRFRALTDAMKRVRKGSDTTLHGCQLLVKSETLRICREARAVEGLRKPASSLWDGRWQAAGPDLDHLEIACLGEPGLAQCPGWRESGLPRKSLLSAPALWRENELIASPTAGLARNFTITLVKGREDFNLWLLSH